jgi:hypothetical protein
LKEGELIGKDEIISTLNLNINLLKNQLDSLGNHGELQEKVNSLQRIVDDFS